MLSATNTVNDVKAALMNTYDAYGFADDSAFESFITRASVQTYLNYMLPALDDGYYSQIEAKDKVDLTEIETYIYWAEVHFIACDAVSGLANKARQTKSGSSTSITAEGYSQSINDPTSLGYDKSAMSFFNIATGYLARAGYPIMRLKRGGSFYTEDSYDWWRETE